MDEDSRPAATAAALVVVAGLPGTGKTTLARSLSSRLAATYLRVDAIETALERITGTPPTIDGYAVAHEVARSNLLLGRPVVVDAVCPVPESRSAWRALAAETGSRCIVIETVLDDLEEHARRVELRRPDLAGQRVPSWAEVQARAYAAWDEQRDGPRIRIDTGSASAAVDAALVALSGIAPR